MSRRLKYTVGVMVDGEAKFYGPDDDVPASVAKELGDHVWEDGSMTEESPVPQAGGLPLDHPAAQPPEVEAEQLPKSGNRPDKADGETEQEKAGEPPKRGPGRPRRT